jgi:ectoine hydroxylase
MQLSDQQIRSYDEQGFILLRGLFSEAEMRLLQRDAAMLGTPRRAHADANVYEKDGETIRAAWAVEKDSAACARALRSARVLGPVRQLLGEDVYLYHSRLNFKIAGRGDVFQWHTDYASWEQDGVPRGGHRDMVTAMIVLDDTAADSGPVRYIPGSHLAGPKLAAEYDTTTTSYAIHKVPDELVARMLAGGAPEQCVEPAGTVAIFAPGLVHGSEANRSGRDRRNLYFVYNRRDNQPIGAPKRKHATPYILSDDRTRLEMLEQDALAV